MSAQNTHCNFSKLLKLKIESVCSFVHNLFESLKSWEFKSLAGSTVVKNLPASAGDADSIPGLGRCPGGGHGNRLQWCYLEKPMDRGAWWTTVHRVTKSRTWLRANTHTHTHTHTQSQWGQSVKYGGVQDCRLEVQKSRFSICLWQSLEVWL